MAKSRKTKGKEVELAVATTSLIDSSKGVGGGKAKTPRETPPQRNQPGGGYLQTGNPGNKGGGRSPEEIKGSFRKLIAEKGLPWAERVLDAPETAQCPKCGTEVKAPAADGVRARLLDTATRGHLVPSLPTVNPSPLSTYGMSL